MKDAALTVCPQCKKRKVTRLISGGGGVIFKGDGFWETDYNRSKDYTAKAKSEAGTTDKPAATPTAATPTKAEAPAKTDPTPAKPAPKPTKDGSSKPDKK